jgi:hypothetical protein
VADKELFGDRRRSQEEEYFRRQEQELIEKLKQRGRDEAARRRLAERSGVADEEILEDLQALGYTAETVMLLHLMPLIQMAWAEGDVSAGERVLIVEAARAHGVEPGSAADKQLTAWLTHRPADDLFEKTLRVIAAILQTRPPDERDASQKDLVSRLTSVASASGGILGFGKVSAEEQQVLSRITQQIERAHQKQATRDTT